MSCSTDKPTLQRPRLPEWLRLPLPTSNTFSQTRSLLDGLRLHTVCESARCPNHWECWMRDPGDYIIVVASPYGSADGAWHPSQNPFGA